MAGSAQPADLLKTTDIAKQLRITDRAVRKWITVGLGGRKLKARRAGPTGNWFVVAADLEDFLTSNNSDDR